MSTTVQSSSEPRAEEPVTVVRKRANLDEQTRAQLAEHEGRVAWETFIHFDQDPSKSCVACNTNHAADAVECTNCGNRTFQGNHKVARPYEPGPSLFDRDQCGHLTFEYAPLWPDAVVVHASDGTHNVDVMLDVLHLEQLLEGLRRHNAGVVADWLGANDDPIPLCPMCEGAGLTRRTQRATDPG